jgi:signal transduction histidine kinase
MIPKKLISDLSICVLLFVVIFPAVKMGSQTLDSTIIQTSSDRDSLEQLKDLIQLSKELLNTQPEVSLNYAKNALYLARSLKSKELEIDALHRVSAAYKDKGQLDSAYLYNGQAKKLCDLIKDENRLADILLMRGTILFRYQGPDTARLFFTKSLKLYQRMADSVGMANALNGIGAAFMRLSSYDSAIYYFHRVIDISEKINHLDGLSKAYLNLGIAYTEIPDLNLAQEYLLRSIPVSTQLNKKRFIALAYNNLGTVAQDQLKPELAFDYYTRGYEMYEELGNKQGMANVSNHIGNMYIEWEAYDKAIIHYNKAKKLFREIGDMDGYISAMHNIGSVYLYKQEYDQAIEVFDSCLLLAKEIHSLRRMKDLYDVMQLTYALNSEFENAYKYVNLFDALKDSIFNIEKSKQIAELEIKYEKEKDLAYIYSLENENLAKDLQLRVKTNQRNIYLYTGIGIIALVSFIAIYFRLKARKDKIISDQKIRQLEDEKRILAAKAVLEGQEEERKRVAKELHDGLGVLLSTASIHFSAIKDEKPKNKDLIAKANELIHQATGDLREISHNIMPGLLTKFGFFEAVQELMDKVNDTEDINASYVINCDKIRLPENMEIMLYRIVQELVHNTLKHAQAKNILLDFSMTDSALSIIYSDDGTGFDLNEKLEQKSIGLQSILSRIHFLNGQFTDNSTGRIGVHFEIVVPVNLPG